MSTPGGKPPDPLGKRALFWAPPTTGAGPVDDASAASPVTLGKRALYSTAPADEPGGATGDNPVTGRGRFVVTCSRCRQARRIGLVDLVIYQFPVGVWLPRGRFDRWMTCPACRRRVWASVTLRR